MDVKVFESQIRFLKRHFEPIRLLDLAHSLREGRGVPRNAVVITVDDGYEDFLTSAVPVLLKYGVPATIFVVSEFVKQGIWLWFDALRYACFRAEPGQYEFPLWSDPPIGISISSVPSRERAWERLADAIIRLPDVERSVRQVADKMKVNLPAVPTEEYRAVTWQQLRSLDEALFEVGGHSRTHAILSLCGEEELRRELIESKRDIEREIGKPVTSLCYPNGQPSDYDFAVMRVAEDAGYTCAVAAHQGIITRQSNLFALPRTGAAENVRRFRFELNGWSYLRRAGPWWGGWLYSRFNGRGSG